MNIRLRGNSIRFRISSDEFKTLAAGQSISETTVFPGGPSLPYSISAGSASEGMTVTFQNEQVDLSLADPVLEKLKNAPAKSKASIPPPNATFLVCCFFLISSW